MKLDKIIILLNYQTLHTKYSINLKFLGSTGEFDGGIYVSDEEILMSLK